MANQFDPFDPFSPQSGPPAGQQQQSTAPQAGTEDDFDFFGLQPQNLQHSSNSSHHDHQLQPHLQPDQTTTPEKSSTPIKDPSLASFGNLTIESGHSPQSDITPYTAGRISPPKQDLRPSPSPQLSTGTNPFGDDGPSQHSASTPSNSVVGMNSKNGFPLQVDHLGEVNSDPQQHSQRGQSMVGGVSVDTNGASMAHNVTITQQFSYNVTSSKQQQQSVPPTRPPTYPQPSQEQQPHHQLPPKSPMHQRNMNYQNQSNQMRMQRRPSNSNLSSTGSMASSSAYSSRSVFGDKSFAPPPQFPKSLELIKAQYMNQVPREVASTLPEFHEIKHSGEVVARFSVKSMLIKKWRITFWITYGKNRMLFFRSKNDFDEWVSNPFLQKPDRDKLVKLSVDFKNDVFKPGMKMKGYQATPVKVKGYNREGNLCHFKLERWYSYGPSVLAAFGGKNEYEVQALHRIMLEMIFKAGHGKHGTPGNDSDVSNSSYYGSEAQSVRDPNTDFGGSNYADSNYGGGYMSDTGMSARSAPPLGASASADYSELLLEGGRSMSYQEEPEVPPMPANHQYHTYDTDFNSTPMQKDNGLVRSGSWRDKFSPIPVNQGLVRSSSWRDKFSRSKSAPRARKESGREHKNNVSNAGGPGAKQIANRKAVHAGWRSKIGGSGEDSGMFQRTRSNDPNKSIGLGKKRSFRFGKKKEEESVQFYVGGSPHNGSHPVPTYSKGSQYD